MGFLNLLCSAVNSGALAVNSAAAGAEAGAPGNAFAADSLAVNTLHANNLVADSVSADSIAGSFHAESIANYMHGSVKELFTQSGIDEICNIPDWSVLGDLGMWSAIFGAGLVILFLFFSFITKRIPPNFRDISLKFFFWIVWVFGFAVYDVGMCTGSYVSLITNAPMAIIYAFKIFLFDSDVSEIHGVFHESWAYSLCFALVHFFAAVISTLFLIKYFGFNFLCRVKMWGAIRKAEKTFVFWGFNEPSAHLIESIQKKLGKIRHGNYRIIIVRTNKNREESLGERTGFARIFDFLAMPTAELEKLQKLRVLVTSTYTDLSAVKTTGSSQDIIGSVLKLRSLRRILRRRTRKEIHFFFFSDDEKENIHNAALLQNDSAIGHFTSGKAGKVYFYCLARHNSIHRVIEDQNPSAQIEVKVVDSSHINVELLKQNEKYLPANYVDIEGDATVSSAFNALVVGFSEVGLDSVRFLYEFGAFVKTGSTDDCVMRSDFHLDAVDKNMSDLAGTFVANAPAVKPAMPFLGDVEDGASPITLHQMDCRSICFYEKLTGEWIEKLNYAVIATDNDELNISLGVRILKLAARYRKDLSKLCILVRAHNDEDGHISRIAGFYNRMLLAQEAAGGIDCAKFTQERVEFNASADGPIYIFGMDEKVFTYENIIDDSLKQKAIDYKERYENSANPKKKPEKPEEKEETEKDEKKEELTAWEESYRDLMLHRVPDNEQGTLFSPTFGALMKLRRTQGQDMANALHALTKSLIARKALERVGLPEFDWKSISRSAKEILYTLVKGKEINPQIERILNVLAQTEHLRWNASHELLGYVQGGPVPCTLREGESTYKHEIRLLHSCLTTWQNLNRESKSYDFNVVDVALDIITPENPIKPGTPPEKSNKPSK